LGTQGRLLQQLALDAHDPPGCTQVAAAQRGTPRLSGRQVSLWQTPLQQSHEALQDMVSSRQISPSGLHPWGLRHTPRRKGGEIWQVTGVIGSPGSPADPQQSWSVAQMSPTTWQPLAGWKIRAPVGP
jgi:hypothetical protein